MADITPFLPRKFYTALELLRKKCGKLCMYYSERPMNHQEWYFEDYNNEFEPSKIIVCKHPELKDIDRIWLGFCPCARYKEKESEE